MYDNPGGDIMVNVFQRYRPVLLASAGAIAVYLSLPYHIAPGFLKNLYMTGLIVMAIISAELLAGLLLTTILYGKNDQISNALIRLPELKSFSRTICFSLIYFAALYFHTSYIAHITPTAGQNKTWISLGVFLFLLSIFSCFRLISVIIQVVQKD